jgi:aromatic ring-opening dioxygenase catalytic subunit (LigB family)
MPIVYSCAASHAPGIRAWTEACPPDQKARLFAGFEEISNGLAAARPDVVLLLTSEHWANFFEHVGAFCVGRGASFEGPVEPWLRVEKTTFTGDPAFAERLLTHCYAQGFEPSFSHEMKLDHGSIVPLSFLNKEAGWRLVPLMFNTLAPPRAQPARCLALGRALRAMLDAAPERIAIIATGGMSHDPGEIGHGRIDSAFDAAFLKRLESAQLDELAAYTDADLAAAGAGTLELLAWICLAGIMGERGARVIAYEPVTPWATGIGLIAYDRAA